MAVANPDFELWDNGSTFISGVNLVNGQETADGWFYNKGAAGSSFNETTIRKNTINKNTGTASLRFRPSSALSGANTTTYVYQDISNYTDFLDQDVVLTVAISNFGANTARVIIDDGISQTSSGSISGSGWQTARVNKHISSSATMIRIILLPEIYGSDDSSFDTVAFGTTLQINPFDSATPSAGFQSNGAFEGFEGVLLDEHTLGTLLIQPGQLHLSDLLFPNDIMSTNYKLLFLVDNLPVEGIAGTDGHISFPGIITMQDYFFTNFKLETITMSDSLMKTVYLSLSDSTFPVDTISKQIPLSEKSDVILLNEWVTIQKIPEGIWGN